MVEGLLKFGPELRREREAKGIGLRELARVIHYSAGYVSKIERRLAPPTADFVEACARILALSPELVGSTLRAVEASNRVHLARPAQLPTAAGNFVGRTELLRFLDDTLANGVDDTTAGATRIALLDGAPGIGKTAVALHWAHANVDKFPDGVLFANLKGFAPNGTRADPEDVLEDWIRAFGVSADNIPNDGDQRAALMRTLTTDKRILVVLDNAATASQVLPLLPASSTCLVIITTRASLTELVTATGARQAHVDELPRPQALELLRNIVGESRIDDDEQAAQTIVQCCGNLPLALRIAAQYIVTHPHDTLAELTARFAARNAGDSLGIFTAPDNDSIRSAFAWSYDELSGDAQALFRLLGLHTGAEIGVEAAAALVGASVNSILPLVDELVAGHLLDNVAPRRYRLHDLLRAYAIERAENELTADQRDAAVRRLLSWYLHSACSANDALAPHRGQPTLPRPLAGVEALEFSADNHAAALEWCEVEADNLLAATEHAHQCRHLEVAWLLPIVQYHFFQLRKLWRHWIRGTSIGLIAAREAGDRHAEAWCLHNAGWPFQQLRRSDEALRYFEAAVDIREEIGDQWGLGWSTFALGATYGDLARPHEAKLRLTQSIDVFRAMDFTYGIATAKTWLGTVHQQLGDLTAAAENLNSGMECFSDLGAIEGQAQALVRLAVVERDRGRLTAALDHLDHALKLRREEGDLWGQAEIFLTRGQILRARGDNREARAALSRALEMFENLLDPRASDVRAELDTLDLWDLPRQIRRRTDPGNEHGPVSTLCKGSLGVLVNVER